MNIELTLSKDLTRSNFRTKTLEFLVFMECNNSWVMPTGSVICLSLRKPNCWADKGSVEDRLQSKGSNLGDDLVDQVT